MSTPVFRGDYISLNLVLHTDNGIVVQMNLQKEEAANKKVSFSYQSFKFKKSLTTHAINRFLNLSSPLD